MRLPVFLLLLPLFAHAQPPLTYISRLRDDIGHDNCCTLTQVLQLYRDSSFRYYQLNNQGDYTTEGLAAGRYHAEGGVLRFDSEHDSSYQYRYAAPFHQALRPLRGGGLRGTAAQPFIAGGLVDTLTWQRIDWRRIDSLELNYWPWCDSVAGYRHIWISASGELRYRFESSNGNAHTSTRQLGPATVVALRNLLANEPLFEAPRNPEDLCNPSANLLLSIGGRRYRLGNQALSPTFLARLFSLLALPPASGKAGEH
ncbi:hypothetical protein [Flaviaesturariibacter terrae]